MNSQRSSMILMIPGGKSFSAAMMIELREPLPWAMFRSRLRISSLNAVSLLSSDPARALTTPEASTRPGRKYVGLRVRQKSKTVFVDDVVAVASGCKPPAFSVWATCDLVKKILYQFDLHPGPLDHQESAEVPNDSVIFSTRSPRETRGMVADHDRATRQVLCTVGKEVHGEVRQGHAVTEGSHLGHDSGAHDPCGTRAIAFRQRCPSRAHIDRTSGRHDHMNRVRRVVRQTGEDSRRAANEYEQRIGSYDLLGPNTRCAD